MRIVRVWNQTGQKQAGEPDIAKSFLPSHNYLLWLLVLLTYIDVIQRLSRRSAPWASRQFAASTSLTLGVAALIFKVAFTNADAPELLKGMEPFVVNPLHDLSLVAQARAVFASMMVMTALTSLPSMYLHFSQKGQAPGTVYDIHFDTL